MRSIHKKTLKRFLSTLLALTMVLGMVPFTASAAAPATVTLEQSGLKATITPSVPAVTAGNTSTVTYAVTIEATAATASGKNVSLTIGPPEHYMSYAFGTVTITGSAITGTVGMPAGLALSGGKITGTVTGGGYAIGSHTVPMSLTVSDLGTDTDSTTFTVDQKAALTVTATPNPVKAGEDFTVTATSDVAEGYVKFTYGTDDQRVAVIPDENDKGIASATFTATGTVGAQTVTALQYAMTGVVNTEATETITVNAATVYRTITFDGNAVDAYHVPAAGTVATGGTYTVTDAKPNRTGYTFVGWSEDKNATTATYTGTGTETITNVTSDKTLYAVWTKNTVTLIWPNVSAVAGVTSIDKTAGNEKVPEGSTVTFKVTVDPAYDVSTMVVTAGGVALAPVATVTANEYQYSFVATANSTYVWVSDLQLTPVYHSITFLPGAADAYIPFSPTTVSVKDGESYTLPTAIPTREGYTFKGWDKNGDGTADYPYNGSTYTTPAFAPAADVTLNAVWEETKYTIKYSKYGSSAADYTTPKTAAAAVGETVYFGVTVPDGYDASTMCVVVENTIVLAPYNSISGTGNTIYYYSFVLTQNMASGGSVDVVFTGPSKLTYTVMMPVGHFTAKLTMANGATVADPGASASVEYGGSYTFTVTPASGYEIKGVYVNGEKQTGSSPYTVTNVTSAQTVEVVVDEIPSYTVTYVVNDAQYTTQKVTSGQQIGTLPDDPVVEGYTFNSWNTKQNGTGTEVTTATTVDSDMTVYAKLTAKTYTITYNPNGGSGAPTAGSKTHGTAVALSTTVPSRTGYTFLGWGTSATATAASYQPGDVYSTDAAVTLYAVWQINTFTVTLPNGTGYTAMPAAGSSSPVDYDEDFTFTVTVDPEYAVATPIVKVNGSTLNATSSSGNTYTYTIENIQENKVVSVSVTKNSVYTVTFMVNGSVYQTQQVEHGAKATVPNPPTVEGYTFGGWYKNTDFIDANKFDFTAGITEDTTVYGKMTAITPKVSWIASGTGWTLSDVKLSGTSTAVTNGGTVAYKSSIDFNVIVKEGYDATNLAVAANGLALNPVLVTENGDGTTTYSFILPNITADQKITVTGVARKMITITYNDNGGIGGPGQEQVKYYLSDTDCGEISTVKPTRVGYEFLGWATTNNATAPAYSNPAKTTPVTSKIANFTTDTTLYAVWSAKTTTVTLTVDKTSQYEVENVVLTAEVKSGTTAVTSGSVQFYRTNNSGTDELIGTAKVSGGKAVLTIATSAYKHGTVNTDSYTVKFIPDEGSGYSEADTTADPDAVTVLSAAISWKLDTGTPNPVADKANVLTIKKGSSTETSMTAGQEYTLELPAIYALDATTYSDATKLVVNKDYTVTWQFRNASGTWEDYTAAAGTDSVKILAKYSKYVFRAVVTPLTGATGHFTKAAVYDAPAMAGAPKTLKADTYEGYLVTETTPEVEQQQTTTKLKVSNTNNIGPTVAQFEGQKVTLTATVTLSGSTTKVTTGEVYFYNGATLIGKADVQSDGTAVLEATISEYNRAVTDQKDTFKAVYQNNATYKTSTSDSKDVLIRSTAIVWAKDTSGAEVKTLTVTPTGDIYADNQYTLTLPAIKEEGQDVTLTVGTDYVVSWYMVKADKTVVLLAENTQSNTYTVVPPTAGVTYYAVVSPKAGSNYTDAYEGTTTKNFLTSAETAASVKAPTVTTITFGDVKTDTGKIPDFSQYEEKTITITAKVVEADLTTPTTAKTPEEVVKSGTVTFYVVTTNGTNVVIGTAAVDNSGQATVDYTLPEFSLATTETLDNIEYFFAMYTDTVGTYADSNTTDVASSTITDPLTAAFGVGETGSTINNDTEAVQILSTSISWKLDGDNKIAAASATTTDANKLTIYVGTDTTGTTTDKMTAGSTYTLKLPAVYALDDAQTAATALTVNKDYTVVWQYREFGTSQWADYPNTSAGNTVLITPDYSGYQFQAVVTPVYDNEHLTGYKTAAAYTNDVATGKTSSLITDPTEKTERQATTTALEITGADNEGTVNIAGTSVTTGLAQFEGQKVTLKATVTDNSTSKGVLSGYVKFYRYVDGTGTGDKLLNTTQVAVDEHGIATFDVTIKDYTDAGDDNATEVLNNVDKFYAVYEENATYATSSSVANPAPDEVYIKSTTIKTPVIDAKRGTTDEGSTTYTADLTGLLAGVEHTFTLRTGNAAADWSVVALDGRTVASTDYDIVWNVKTGDNTVTDATVGCTFVTTDNKVGDEISVTLNPKGDMTKGNTSKKAIIGTKQDVNVTVTAEDKITSTPETDVYQLNEIKLTATVAAVEGANATVKPTGTVTFYYSVNGTAWTKVGETTDLAEAAGVITASITTDKLPVAATTNTKQNVTITAIYSGDETFNKSGTIDTNSAITDTTGCTVTDETVTVYSSVVYVDAAENTTNTPGADCITISAEDGKVLANETNVKLMLSDVYTLDHADALSKLAYGVDYTVQWQKLVNAAAYGGNYAAVDTPWVNITGATNTTCQINVEDGAAYRAVITVKDTPIAKGSYTFVDQVIDGRQVYYSNILVAADAPATVTVNVNTDKTGAGFEGIVQGEKVTIHTFASGATGTTPISELTMTLTNASGAEVDKQVKTNVNGHVSFDWVAAQPGYYTLTVNAKFTNGYSDKTITRTLIVRDNDYGFNVTRNEFVYDGQVQGLELSVTDMGIEDPLAQKSVVVYYYDKDNKQVEPTQAGTYKAVIRLQESAYWTEKKQETTLTIKQREVSVVDLIAQAKVYDGTTNANIQEIILNDAVTAQTTTGLPTGDTGIINGDSVYAEGTGYTASANAGATTLGVKDVTLKGNDAANYKLADATYTEAFNIQRSQVKGDIANSTFKYTGSNITVPADDIYLIDQAGNKLSNYTVTYYYHNGDGVEKVDAMNKLGKYTVIARPEQNNYKGGASQTVYVVEGAGTDATPTAPTSALIDITNTVELFGATTGIKADIKPSIPANGATITKIEYQNGTGWTETVPTDAGRYLVKVTTDTDATAYGIYTIVKANPVLTLSATGAEYTSAQISGTPTGTYNGTNTGTVNGFPAGTYYTYTGGTIQGVAYEAPTEVGTYIVTAHVPETENYTAHEISAQFVITPKALEITADSLQRHQYSAYPDMTASFDGLATEGVAADTSLRDVQIQPELVFDAKYTNDASDQVGNYSVTPVAALARNYAVSYASGNISVTAVNPNPELAIHGMIENGNGAENLAYYGDVIQLYAYGSQSETGVINNSSVLTWSVTNPSICGTASISQDGLLEVNGVGTFTVTLTRGVGAQKISTSITITALKQEVKVVVPELNTVYNATSQDYTTKNTMIAVNAKGEQVFTGKDRFVINGNTRIDVGSQIVTGKVVEGVYTFQSETYGGLFTINDKEVTVKPDAASVVYGEALGTLTYSETGTVGGVNALTNGKAVSIRDSYVNLDVLDGYEILVAGVENMNYNVKYITDQTAPDAEVTAKPLTVSTGTLNNNVGMTSDSLNPLGNYPANGAVVDPAAALGASNVRMYGEPNWVMDYALTSLIPGDSLADLALDPLAGNLVKFNYNIGANANITYPTRNDTTPAAVGGGTLSKYDVDTDASMIAFGNYNETYTKGTQNIYQRPVTLALSNGQTTLDIYFTEILASGGAIDVTKLRNIIINNVEAGKYNNEGGLAELLKHTVKDLDLQVTTDFTTGATQFTATVTVGNQNYWLGNAGQKFDITVNILYQRLTVDYTTFTATFSDVILYEQTETTRTPAYATGDVTFIIYRYVEGQENYSYYAANETAVVSELMTMDTSRTGRYYVTYPKLSAGTYRMFAVASGYTIID